MSEPQKLTQYEQAENYSVIEAQHPDLDKRSLYCANHSEGAVRETPLLFTENNTNHQRLSCKEDVLHLPSGENIDLKVRSLVGLIPLFAVTTAGSPQTKRGKPT